MSQITIGLAGYGVIGSGVVALLEQNSKFIEKKTGIQLVLKTIVDKDKEKIKNLKKYIVSSDSKALTEDKEIDIVVELTGGKDFPYQLFRDTIENGKHFVTANKALLSEKMPEIFTLLREKKRHMGFEASVGGGIPIIQTIRKLLVANQILSIEGIINGTTNYILTKMSDENLDFQTALKKAQELGFAEADPTLDLNGSDAASKLTILASLCFGQALSYSDIFREGIEDIDLQDILYAKEFGYTIKLIAMAKKDEKEQIEAKVYPCLVSKKNPLSTVKNEFNAILVHGDFLGLNMYYGKGAGSYPTASAVVSDIINIANKIVSEKSFNDHEYTLYQNKNLKSVEDFSSRFYIRFMTEDKPGILAKIASVLGENSISIASVSQKDTGEYYVPVVITTHQAFENQFQKSIETIKHFPFVNKIVYYRILD